MRIIGVESAELREGSVHTIDVWYSRRRGRWIVERLDAEGGLVGVSHACGTAADALLCIEEWSRAHAESVLVAALERAEQGRKAVRPARLRRHAA